jgi:hypothetical protein
LNAKNLGFQLKKSAFYKQIKYMKTSFTPLVAFFFVALILLTGCIFYQRYPMAKSRLTKIDKTNLTFYLLDAARPTSRVWYVSEADFQKNEMIGFLIRLNELEAHEVATVQGRHDARYSKNDVLMYVKPKHALALADTMTLTIPYDQLEKIEVYEVNHGKSLGITLLSCFLPIIFFASISVG